MQSSTNTAYFGKYREIILSVMFFIVCDLAVLALNFYISFQISEDARGINLAGRQRMLSQRVSKALLTAESNLQRGIPNQEALAEIKKTVELFDITLLAFQHGGAVIGGDEKPASLAPLTEPESKAILADADAIWRPYKLLLDPLLSSQSYQPDQFDSARRYARDNNLQLLALMNNLTSRLEQGARSRTETLRKIQTGGILLALLNFAFILFKFIRRLNENDREAERAQKETDGILGNVQEGLFLLDAQFRIGSQFSGSLSQLLGRKVMAGDDFRTLLRQMVPTATFTRACDYIALLFDERAKWKNDMNPLGEIGIAVRGEDYSARRFLSLRFDRVLEAGKVSRLLVTAINVPARTDVKRAFPGAKEESKAEIEIMLDLLKVNPGRLNLFLGTAEQKLSWINDQLTAADLPDYRQTVNTVFREMHGLRNEAASLRLESFETQAHEFENLLSTLPENGPISRQDLRLLPFPLKEFLHQINAAHTLTMRLAACHDAFAPMTDSDALTMNLINLAQRFAHAPSKQVQLEADHLNSLPPKTREGLEDIATQTPNCANLAKSRY